MVLKFDTTPNSLSCFLLQRYLSGPTLWSRRFRQGECEKQAHQEDITSIRLESRRVDMSTSGYACYNGNEACVGVKEGKRIRRKGNMRSDNSGMRLENKIAGGCRGKRLK